MYLFNGIFTYEDVDCEKVSTSEFIVKQIDRTSLIGIYFSHKQNTDDIYKVIEQPELDEIIHKLDISEGLWLSYFCWGGDLESVAGIQFKGGKLLTDTYLFSDDNNQEEIFAELMKKYNIPLGKNGYFAPFERGYWEVKNDKQRMKQKSRKTWWKFWEC